MSPLPLPTVPPVALTAGGTTQAGSPEHSDLGLTGSEAQRRLKENGPNGVEDTAVHPLRTVLKEFWAPIQWLLEAAAVLQFLLGETTGGVIILALLLFNASLGYAQQSRAQATLATLKSRLALNASVRRDGAWTTVAAAGLVQGDVLKLSLGAIVPADVRLLDGNVQLDQSVLTGESLPTEAGAGFQAWAGALVRRGEATAEVTATGARTKFGRTAELVRTAHVESSQQKIVLGVVRNLALCNGALTVLMVSWAHAHAMSTHDVVMLGLTALLASIPVALPATFTLAAALGARALALQDVLPTRLSAVEEAATMDVLCVDKTGTLTRNALAVASVRAMPGFNGELVLGLAALASSEGGQDAVDAAGGTPPAGDVDTALPRLVKFVPFDPAAKMSEASAEDPQSGTVRIVKGAFATIQALALPLPAASSAAAEFEAKGYRVLAVAKGNATTMQLVGLIALSDPPRADAASAIAELREMGVRTVMVTGDAPATAAIVARAVGLTGAICPPGQISGSSRPEDFAVFAGVLPEDKFKLVKAFQHAGHTVGMCGDGVNDAPALRQAQIGIAVSTATDVAKSAAGVVLIQPGLGGILAAVKQGRIMFQRILTYTINSVTKKIVQVLLIGAGLLVTGHAVLTPILMVLIMITGDFLGMSMTTDNVLPSPTPNVLAPNRLSLAGGFMGLCELGFCLGVLMVGRWKLGLDTGALSTLAFLAVVFGNQATTYAIRSRRLPWTAPFPSRWLALSSCADILISASLAIGGTLMTHLPAETVALALLAAMVFACAVGALKVPVFSRLGIGR
jgi:H+-transporting ATPase